MSYANPTMLAGPSQGASGSQGPQGMDLRTAWENLARAQMQNADSQLQYAAAKCHTKFIKFRGGKDGIAIETYILRNEQLFT